MAQAVADCPGFSVVGGGDSASALEELGLCRPGGLPLDRWRCLADLHRERRGPARRSRRCATPRTHPASGGARRPLISGNWKMHHDHIEALHMVRDLGLRLKPDDVPSVDVSVHPPFTDLRTVQTLIEKEGIPVALGAQHCSDEDAGARTGEVSPRMLARLATAYVIVGHSERRTLFGMADATVAATLKAVLRHDMTPIVCVGETEEERAAGKTEAKLEEQVLAALEGLSAEQVGGLVFAYEPIWAIGTGQAATPMDAEDACVFIRSMVAKAAGDGGGRGGPDPVRGLGQGRQCRRPDVRAQRGRAPGGRGQPARRGASLTSFGPAPPATVPRPFGRSAPCWRIRVDRNMDLHRN